MQTTSGLGRQALANLLGRLSNAVLREIQHRESNKADQELKNELKIDEKQRSELQVLEDKFSNYQQLLAELRASSSAGASQIGGGTELEIQCRCIQALNDETKSKSSAQAVEAVVRPAIRTQAPGCLNQRIQINSKEVETDSWS